MRKNYITMLLVSALPLGFALTATAQSSIPVQPAGQATDASQYNLQSNTLPVPGANVQHQGATNYELSGTRISGASASSTNVILTTPVGSAGAYKTESGIYLYPSVFTGVGYNSNVGSSSSNEAGSSMLIMAPQLVAEIKNKGDRYTALVSSNATRYASSAQDNTIGSELKVAGDNYFSSRARAGWSAGVINASDPRRAGIRTSVDKYSTTNLNGRLIYGAPEASGRLELDLGTQDKSYENNRATTERLDLTLNSVAGRAYYRLGTRSLALGEIRNSRSRYASALSTASNNTERRYYAGLTWDATAATTGIVKVGHMTKDFDQGNVPGFSGPSWEATVRWMPLTYSVVDLQTAKSTSDSTGVGGFEIRTSNDVTWNHKWTQSLTSRVALGRLATEFSGAGRKDTAINYALTMDYAVRRWLKMGVDLAGTDNTSNIPSAEYKRTVTMFTLNASL